MNLEPRQCFLYLETTSRGEFSATKLEGGSGGGNFLLDLLISLVETPDKLLRVVFPHQAWQETVGSKVNTG